MKSVDLTVDVPSSGILQPIKNETIQTNGLTIISPSSGYDAMEQVNATININHNNQISYMKLYSDEDVLIDTFDFDDMNFTTIADSLVCPINKSLVVVYRQSYGYDVYLNSSYSQNTTVNVPPNTYYKQFDGNNTTLLIYNYEDMIINEIKMYKPDQIYQNPGLLSRTYTRDSYYEQAMVGQISNYPITTNGSINVPIPIPYSVVDQISLNVNVPSSSSLTIDNILWPNNTTKKISTFTKRTTSGNVTFSANYLCVLIDTQTTGYWRLRVTYQISQNQQYMYAPGFYATLNVGSGATNSTIDFRDSSNVSIFKFNDPMLSSSTMGEINFSKDIFNWDISI